MKTKTRNAIQQANALGQAVWLDYIRRGLLKSGEMRQLVETGISGLTANPTILEKAIVGSTDYDDALPALAASGKSPPEIYEALAVQDLQATADLLLPTYKQTNAADGYACLEISPLVAYDTERTIAEGRRLFKLLDRPNVMVKVPATREGLPAIRQLTAEGVNVNVTLIFSLDYYREVREAYIAGLEELARKGADLSRVSSVASFFLSRIDTLVDGLLEERLKKGEAQLSALRGQAATASARLAYQAFKEDFYGQRFAGLKAKGAQVQRVLWASTGTKNPAYSDLKYVETLIGRDTVNTMPLATIYAFLDHGRAEATLEQGLPEAEQALRGLEGAGISLPGQVTDRLLTDGVKAFADSFDQLMAGIEAKKSKLKAEARLKTDLQGYAADVARALDKLGREDVVRRIWRKDHTVWKPKPTEIANRLGWLTVSEFMREQLPALESLAAEVKQAGFRHAVLLGMGGSSLGAEVLRQVFGPPQAGYPGLFVLDSTVPAAVRAVSEAIQSARTLFIVSSKSGTTTEPLILYKYFKSLVEKEMGQGKAGGNFVAITDAGTPLAKLAGPEGFRRVFLNPADIGGRYSVLSYFGLVPAALLGIDIKLLLERADGLREGCASCVPQKDNHGAWLGAGLGTLAQKGRDKVTLVTSPSVSSFGLWVEQLLAESTGKEGKGLVPVAGEPLVPPAHYGEDRLFIYLRLKDDDNASTDATIAALQSFGQPAVVLEMQDKYDLGGEFFRWQFATAVAGAVLGIHPFDQPNVQQAKEATEALLKEFKDSGHLPLLKSTGSLREMLAKAGPGRYLAVMAYLRQTPEMDDAFRELRRKVLERYHIATTLGYGPRFLHSTGQLHKGGPNTGLFLQLTADHTPDLPIPGEPYTFGTVADAQALGDLRALQQNGRVVTCVHLPQASAALVRQLADQLG